MPLKNSSALLELQGRFLEVALVDDHPMVRVGLRNLLESYEGIRICCEAADAETAWEKISVEKPSLAILDLLLTAGSSLDLIRRIRDAGLPTKILIYTMHDESLYGERVFLAGADGFVSKEQPTRVFLQAIADVVDGKSWFSDATMDRLREHPASASGYPINAVSALTNRELEVFELMGHGQSTQQIANHLSISPKTVESHRLKIKEKFGGIGLVDLQRRAALWVAQDGSTP